MQIVHLTAELAPIAKVGGLADVLHGLSRELVRQGHEVELILPRHSCIPDFPIETIFTCTFDGQEIETKALKSEVDGLPVFFLDPDSPFFPREQIYGYLDDVERYTFFALAALRFLEVTGRTPDILHLHEWQTALAAPLSHGKRKIAFTIHNLAHQGQCSTYDLDRVGLVGQEYLRPDRMQDDRTPTLINLMKGGITYADCVNTVSPTYAQEILDKVHHHGLEPTLVRNQEKFCGILNGLDTEVWNPADDPHLQAGYTASEMAPKSVNKRWVQERCGLEVDRPLISTVTRLAMQKGIPLVRRALLYTLEQGGQFVILGSPSTPRIEEEFSQLRDELQGNPNVHIELGQDEALAHQLFAGSDMLLAPSLFEPCGLVQMIGMRYGAVPIVRKTGGLADTVEEGVTGFLFEEPTSQALDRALGHALSLYGTEEFAQIQQRGMEKDQSWKQPAKEYIEMYNSICQ